MKEDKFTQKLKTLKKLEPNSKMLASIKDTVYLSVQNEKKETVLEKCEEFFKHIFIILKTKPLVSYAFVVGIFLIAFIVYNSGFLFNNLHKIELYAEVETAPNQYLKARIALADTQSSYSIDTITDGNATNLSQSIAFSNTQLSQLKLKGEKGKYTMQECRALYSQYIQYLQTLQNKLAFQNENKQSVSKLKTQIISYTEQAEIKVHRYKQL